MKKVAVWLLAALLLFSLCACGQSGLRKVNVNEVTHSVFYAPQYAAMALGFFEEEGLEIDLVNGGGSDKSMTALLSGDADIGLMGPETAVYVYNQGKEDHPMIVGQLTKRDGSLLVGREKDDGFDWQSLKGKTIIGGRKGGMPQMTLEYVRKLNGLTPGTDGNVRTDVQVNLMAGAFEGSDAEFVTLFEPTASLCEREGKGYIVAAVGAQCADLPYTCYMVRPETIEKDADMVQGYLNAVAKGQAWVLSHTPAEVAEVIAPQFPDSDEELLKTVVENYQSIGAWMADPVLTPDAFTMLQDILDDAGELTARVPHEDLVNNTFAEKARDSVQ